MANDSGALTKYLVRRGAKGRFYVRLAVPRPLHAMWGKRERIKALGTSDRDLAERAALSILGQWREDERLALEAGKPPAETRQVPSKAELEEVAVQIGFDGVRDYEAQRLADLRGVDRERWERHVRRTDINVKTLSHMAATGEFGLVRGKADAAIEMLGWDISPDSDEYAHLCDLLNRVALSALQEAQQRAAGDADTEVSNKVVDRVRHREATKAKPGETITELFETYAAQLVATNGKRSAGISQDRMVIGQFAEFVGADRAVRSIEYEDAKAFVDALAKIPASYKKLGSYRGLSIHEAIEKGERDGRKTLSVITQQRYISTLSPFFDWLRSERGGRRLTENPFAGLHHDTKKIKGRNRRPSFSAAQITTIVRSPLFTGFQAEGKEHMPGNQRADDWRFWLPLVCLFTGARIGEVAQLHVSDVFQDQEIWCVELRHDESTGQRTKSDKTRVVALHSTLIAIGLLEFVARQRDRSAQDANPQLFPELHAGGREQFGDRPSRWWRDYLVAIGVKLKDGGDGLGSHAFRHTLSDQLRAAGHLDNVFGPIILGHSTKSVTGGYGETRQGTPQLSKMLIESVKFIPIERGKIVEDGEPVDFSYLIRRTRPEC